MTRNDVFYALGIIFVVAIIGLYLNSRQDNMAGRAVFADSGLPSETVTCTFDTASKTCYVHFEGAVFSCSGGDGKRCSITINGMAGKKALVTSGCGDEFSATLDSNDETFMFSC